MDDFADAASRHFQDAEILHSQNPKRIANASHLYGFAAECALKHILELKKVKVPKGSNGHLPKLLAEIKNHSMAKGNVALIRKIKAAATGLNQWGIEQRYHTQAVFQGARVDAEKRSAQQLLRLSKMANQKGM